MIKNFLISCALLLSFSNFAQNGTVSPYSFFGLGEFRSNGTVENQMMGGLQMFGDSIHVSLRNPATYSKLLLTTYTAGISSTTLRLEDAEEQQNTSFANLDYLAIGLPLGNKVGVGIGLLPFSSVGYNLRNEQGDITSAFSGEGGVNRVFLSIGFEPIKNLSIGATINYNFGTLEYGRIQSVQDVQFGTLDNRESRITGFDFVYAANYTKKIGDKYTLLAHAGIDTQVNLVSENSQRIGSFSTANGQEIEVIDVDLSTENLRNTEIKLPTRTTLGLGFGEDRKWFLGAEYSFQQLSSFENTFLGIENVRYNDASSVALGGFFVPDYNSFSSYFNRVTYRAGLRYDQSGLVVNNQEINEFGITFGFGLPLGNNFSNLNLGFELGRRGTTDAGLVEENYFRANVGISLNDKWFIKRKIN
jgi:hypothetical protein